MSEDRDRLVDLEILLTHQQALVEDLNLVVTQQADRIDRLGQLVARLGERLAALESEGPVPDRRPPHW